MMNDSFRQLVHDALEYARAQPQQNWFFASKQEVLFFQSSACKELVHPKQQSIEALPKSPGAALRPHISAQKPTQEPPLPIKELKTPVQPAEASVTPMILGGSKAATTWSQKGDFAGKNSLATTSSGKKGAADLAKPPEEIAKVLRKIAPALPISDQIPDDRIAKEVSTAWKEKLPGIDVVLIVLNNHPDTIELMKNLAKAIQKDLGAVKLLSGDRLEQEKRWAPFFQTNSFRLVIASLGIEHYPELLKHYRALPSLQSAFLANIPLIVLEHPSAYTESSNKKISLWKSLCLMLKK